MSADGGRFALPALDRRPPRQVLRRPAWVVLNATLPAGLPLGVVLQGIVLGSLTGLSALGLVLVYRSSRVVNFAQAALGSAASVLAIQLFQHEALELLPRAAHRASSSPRWSARCATGSWCSGCSGPRA